MAKPLERPPGKETDLKDNAFGVSPQALKAVTTERMRQLAIPKGQKGLVRKPSGKRK